MTPTTSGWGGTDGAWIHVSPRSDCVVVTIGGELDLNAAGELAKSLREVLTASRAPCLIIDMTYLSFIDSTGLGVLISTENRAQALGESMVLVHPPPLVRRLLVGTQLQRRFTSYDTLDDALAALRAV